MHDAAHFSGLSSEAQLRSAGLRADGRLRGQRRPALWTAPDRKLHQRIVAQPIEVVGIFIAAGDRRDTCHHHFEHRVSDAVCIAAIGHRFGKSPAHSERALLLSQQQ